MSTDVGDPPLMNRVLDFRTDHLYRHFPLFAHCGFFASKDAESLEVIPWRMRPPLIGSAMHSVSSPMSPMSSGQALRRELANWPPVQLAPQIPG